MYSGASSVCVSRLFNYDCPPAVLLIDMNNYSISTPAPSQSLQWYFTSAFEYLIVAAAVANSMELTFETETRRTAFVLAARMCFI